MFTAAQQDIINSLVPTMFQKGYKNYVVYSNSHYKEGDFTTYQPDLYFIFSKDKISASSAYSYNVAADSVSYACRTVNYSSSSHANNTDRITAKPFSGVLNIEPYEHIYSNAEYSGHTIQPDIMKGERYNETTAVRANGFLFSVALLLFCFLYLFKH